MHVSDHLLRSSPGPWDALTHEHGWMVDTATRRVVRHACAACAFEAAQSAKLEARARALGLEGSNTMKVIKQIEEALEESAAVIDPAEADLRVVKPEEGPEELLPDERAGRTPIPSGVKPRPTPRELGKEHRGY